MAVLSIIIPVFNEINTIEELLLRVERAELPEGIDKEIIIVDDGSRNGTREILKRLSFEGYRVIFHERNRGKGAAVRTGLKYVTGDFVIIQDADLEYNPEDYRKLLMPVLEGKADVVYGSRFLNYKPYGLLRFWHYMGNKILTIISNAFTDLYLTDMETCYKLFTRKAIDIIGPQLVSDRFDIEPEITARVARAGLRVYEVGISYGGRSYSEGKKIGLKDAFEAIWAIIRFNLFK